MNKIENIRDKIFPYLKNGNKIIDTGKYLGTDKIVETGQNIVNVGMKLESTYLKFTKIVSALIAGVVSLFLFIISYTIYNNTTGYVIVDATIIKKSNFSITVKYVKYGIEVTENIIMFNTSSYNVGDVIKVEYKLGSSNKAKLASNHKTFRNFSILLVALGIVFGGYSFYILYNTLN